MRSRFGVGLVPKSDWYRTAIGKAENIPTIFITIADQRPQKPGKQNVTFFGRPTFIQSGAARIASRRNCAVIYADTEKVGTHHYKFTFRLITPEAANMCEVAIMESYYEALENTIRREPAYWLWSHKRWEFGEVKCSKRAESVV